VYLTERGREIQEPIQREIDRIAKTALAGLGPRSRDSLRRSLETVRDNLAGCVAITAWSCLAITLAERDATPIATER
jgi:hypothetical protein